MCQTDSISFALPYKAYEGLNLGQIQSPLHYRIYCERRDFRVVLIFS